MIKNVIVADSINYQECKNFISKTEQSNNDLNFIHLAVDDGSCQITEGFNYVGAY